jgi:hypothetical protein
MGFAEPGARSPSGVRDSREHDIEPRDRDTRDEWGVSGLKNREEE